MKTLTDADLATLGEIVVDILRRLDSIEGPLRTGIRMIMDGIKNTIRRIKRSLGIHTYFSPLSYYLDDAVPEEYTNAARERRGYTMSGEPTARG